MQGQNKQAICNVSECKAFALYQDVKTVILWTVKKQTKDYKSCNKGLVWKDTFTVVGYGKCVFLHLQTEFKMYQKNIS